VVIFIKHHELVACVLQCISKVGIRIDRGMDKLVRCSRDNGPSVFWLGCDQTDGDGDKGQDDLLRCCLCAAQNTYTSLLETFSVDMIQRHKEMIQSAAAAQRTQQQQALDTSDLCKVKTCWIACVCPILCCVLLFC
jgi:hypothetical protein